MDDDELDRLLDEAAARERAYKSWLGEHAAYCHKQGIAFPTGYARQRAWNEHQKKQAQVRKEEKKKQDLINKLQQSVNKLAEMTGTARPEQMEVLPDFDAIDRDARLLEEKKAMDKHIEESRLNALRNADNPNDGEEI